MIDHTQLDEHDENQLHGWIDAEGFDIVDTDDEIDEEAPHA